MRQLVHSSPPPASSADSALAIENLDHFGPYRGLREGEVEAAEACDEGVGDNL